MRMSRLGRLFLNRLRPLGWIALGMSLVLVLAGSDPSRSEAYKLFALIGAMLMTSALSMGRFRVKARAERSGPATCVPGKPVRITVRITNAGRRKWRGVRLLEEAPLAAPTREEFRETPEPGEHRRNPFDRFFIFYRFAWLGERHFTYRTTESDPFDLAPGGTLEVGLVIMPLRRGHLELRRLRLVRDGVFGFFRRLRNLDVPPLRIPVVPSLAHLPLPSTSTSGSDMDPAGPAPRHQRGPSDEFLSLRDYRPGDPLQHIHWATFARAGHPVVREFEDVHRPRTALILDTLLPRDGKAFALTTAFERAVEAAASFAGAMDSGDTLLDLLLVQDRAHSFTGGPGHLHLKRILEILAGVQPMTRGSLARLERLALTHAPRCQSALLLTIQWDDERTAFLSRMRARGVELHAILVHPGGEDPPRLPTRVRLVHPGDAPRLAAGLASRAASTSPAA